MTLLISFEGTEGSGKTTQIELLHNLLQEKGYPVTSTREPGGTRIGEKIRKLLLAPEYREMVPLTEALLYAADRAQHLEEVIAPALERGEVVITDRFFDASLVYQGLVRGLGKEMVRRINSPLLEKFKPDLTFLLDLEPGEGMIRKEEQQQGFGDRIESQSLGFHCRVREAYLQLARSEKRFSVIDASLSAENIHRRIKEEVFSILD